MTIPACHRLGVLNNWNACQSSVERELWKTPVRGHLGWGLGETAKKANRLTAEGDTTRLAVR